MGEIKNWTERIRNRETPPRIHVAAEGHALRQVDVCKGHVLLIGGGPGKGKSALAGQMAFNALRLPGQDQLRVLFANAEMSPGELLDRELARMSGVPHKSVYEKTWEDGDEQERIHPTTNAMLSLDPRVAFMRGPFTCEQLLKEVASFHPDLVVVDYLQRFDLSRNRDDRARAAAVMVCCRQIANGGRAVIALAAINRASRGQKPDPSAFRDSSEVEYGADVAYLIHRPDDNDDSKVVLAAVKNRHGRAEDIHLAFDGDYQEFSDRPIGLAAG